MPRTTRLTSYGAEYEQLLLRAHAHLSNAEVGDEFALDLQSPQAANSLRSKVYAYWAAVRASDRVDLIPLLDPLALRLAGSTLIIFRREDSWDAKALRDALGLARGFADGTGVQGLVAPATQTAALAKLTEIRSRKNSLKGNPK